MLSENVTIVNWCSMFCYGTEAVGEVSAPGMPSIPVCQDCLDKLMSDDEAMKSIVPVSPEEQEREQSLLDRMKSIASSTDY